MSKTVILLNPMGTDVTSFVNGTPLIPQLMKGTVYDKSVDTFYTLPYTNQPGVANINAGVGMLDTKLKSLTGEVLVFGYSEGCQIADQWLTNYGPTSPVSTTDVSFLLIANAERKYGGFVYDHDIFNAVGWTQGKPDDTPYKVIDFARQYDGVSDYPTEAAIQNALVDLQAVGTDANALTGAMHAVSVVMAKTSWANAALNAITGMVLIHNFYEGVSVADPTNISLVEGNITWMWSPTYPVPLLGAGATFPWADQMLRTEIEQAYARPVTIPLPDYASRGGWSTAPVAVSVPKGPVTGWWAQT